VLKVKLAMAIIGISSIHLLKTFIAAGTLNGLPFCPPELLATAASNIGAARCSALTTDGVLWQTIIHVVFIASAIGIAWTDKLMANGSHKAHHAHH
jgi:Predicted membrane protein